MTNLGINYCLLEEFDSTLTNLISQVTLEIFKEGHLRNMSQLYRSIPVHKQIFTSAEELNRYIDYLREVPVPPKRKRVSEEKYTSFAEMPFKITDDKHRMCPVPSKFRCMKTEESSINKMISSRKDGRGKLYTFWPISDLTRFCNYLDGYWDEPWFLDSYKEIVWQYITGFITTLKPVSEIENFRLPFLKLTKNDSIMSAYFSNEVKKRRMVRVKHLPSKAIAAKVFCTPKSNGDNRFVVDKRYANQFNERETFTIPDAELIFSNLPLFNLLLNSEMLAVYDRKDMYRQWWTHPDTWSRSCHLLEFGNRSCQDMSFINIAGDMGDSASSRHCQALAETENLIFNNRNPYVGHAISISDDQFILDANKLSHNAALRNAMAFNLQINHDKNQSPRHEVDWGGYVWNVATKSIHIRPKRLKKMIEIYKEISTEEKTKRRTYAKILGMFYSGRILLYAHSLELSPILFKTRQHASFFLNFADARDLQYDLVYEEPLEKPSDDILDELKLCISIMATTVNFEDVRRGILGGFSFDRYPEFGIFPEDDCLLSDATLHRFGGLVIVAGSKYAFGAEIPDQIKQYGSIAYNELLAAVVTKLMHQGIIRCRGLKKSGRRVRNFTDNTVAQCVLQTTKVSLRNTPIAVLGKILAKLRRLEHRLGWDQRYFRIDTQANACTDELSRSGAYDIIGIGPFLKFLT